MNMCAFVLEVGREHGANYSLIVLQFSSSHITVPYSPWRCSQSPLCWTQQTALPSHGGENCRSSSGPQSGEADIKLLHLCVFSGRCAHSAPSLHKELLNYEAAVGVFHCWGYLTPVIDFQVRVTWATRLQQHSVLMCVSCHDVSRFF